VRQSGAETMNRSFHKSQTLRFYDCSAVEVKSKVSPIGPLRQSELLPWQMNGVPRGGGLEQCGRRPAPATTFELGRPYHCARGCTGWAICVRRTPAVLPTHSMGTKPGSPGRVLMGPRAIRQAVQAPDPLPEICSFVPRARGDPGAPHVGEEGGVSGAIWGLGAAQIRGRRGASGGPGSGRALAAPPPWL
jgi:hypothetical protein